LRAATRCGSPASSHFFVDVFPGNPSAGELESGARIPASQTAYNGLP
jgi:hypothetical protein